MGETTVMLNSSTLLTKKTRIPTHPACRNFSLCKYVLSILASVIVMILNTSYLLYQGDEQQKKLDYLTPEAITSLQTFLSCHPVNEPVVIEGETLSVYRIVSQFYADVRQPVWTGYMGLNTKTPVLLELLGSAREYGLEPDNYHLQLINRISEQVQSDDGNRELLNTQLEIILTDAALKFMVNLHSGYVPVDSVTMESEWFNKLSDILLKGLQSDLIVESMLSVQPQFIEYIRLQQAAARFIQTVQLTSHWEDITFPANDSSLLKEQVQHVLTMLGYYRPDSDNISLTAAIKDFQYFHGLEPDGALGRHTVEALGMSTMQRFTKIALNLDRLRKMDSFDADLLYVNIPAYTLKVFNGNELRDTFKVVVGHPSSPTPIMNSVMEKIVANPVWYVPKRIALNEILPKMKADSNYLSRNRFKILDKQYQTVDVNAVSIADISANSRDYTFKQDNYYGNALGKVKFLFPNPYSVYLHDTPSKSGFSKDIRAFSHGCVRVQDPQRLANYILNNVNLENTDFDTLLRKGIQQELEITGTLPIYIRYITCEADEQGNLFFYKDIYHKDDTDSELLSSENTKKNTDQDV